MTTTTTTPAKRRPSTATLGLFIRERRDPHGYYHVYADPVWVGLTPDEREDIDAGRPGPRDVDSTTVRNASTRYTLHKGLHLDGLIVASQGGGLRSDRRLYGWEVEYREVFSVDARTAKRMHQTLTAVERTIARLNERHGRPATFGQYLLRVAAALGATRIVIPARSTGTYRDDDCRIFDLASGASRVDHLVATWAEEGQQAQEAV